MTRKRSLSCFLVLSFLCPSGAALGQAASFQRGDANADGTRNLTDAVFTLLALFQGGPQPGCLDAADSNDDGALNLTDAVYTLTFLFRGGPAPPEPFAECGRDGTEDGLNCSHFPPCEAEEMGVREGWVARSPSRAVALGGGRFRSGALALDPLGNVYLAGSSYFPETHYDYVIVKYGRDGEVLWSARYNNGAANGFDGDIIKTCIAVDARGDLHLTGTSFGSEETYRDVATVKYGAGGELLWAARYHGQSSETDEGRAIGVDVDGNVYVAATSLNEGTGSNWDWVILKYDRDGRELWASSYSSSGRHQDIPMALAVGESGDVYVTGEEGEDGGGVHYVTIRYDRHTGAEHWVSRSQFSALGGGGGAVALGVEPGGNVFVTGNTCCRPGERERGWLTLKYGPGGDELWAARHRPPAAPEGQPLTGAYFAVDLALDGAAQNLYVAGYATGGDIGYDYLTVKYGAEGNPLWAIRYDGSSYDELRDLAVDGEGSAYVTGLSASREQRRGGSGDWATVKYSPDGRELWAARYGEPSSWSDNGPFAIVADDEGNAYVAGIFRDEEQNFQDFHYVLVKYVPVRQ
ncbi:MAG: hypothetical protein HY721_02900 [Planctomycetes bacterium]|nr:hypothetical protein [Planctomycetota bacterium]